MVVTSPHLRSVWAPGLYRVTSSTLLELAPASFSPETQPSPASPGQKQLATERTNFCRKIELLSPRIM